MNLHKASRRYAESKRKDKRRILSDAAKLPSRTEDAVEEILPPYECFPLAGFQLQPRADRRPIGLDRCKGTRIWRSMRTRQAVSQRTVMASIAFTFCAKIIFLFVLCATKASIKLARFNNNIDRKYKYGINIFICISKDEFYVRASNDIGNINLQYLLDRQRYFEGEEEYREPEVGNGRVCGRAFREMN